MVLVFSTRIEYEPKFSFTSILYPVIGAPPSDGLLHDKLIWVSEITFAVRFGEEGGEIDEDAGSVESSLGVAEAVFDLGLPAPKDNLAFTT